MGYRKIGYLEQLWYLFKYAVKSRLEWWKAVAWAEDFHPAWVEIYNRTRNDEVREVYRNKILRGYRQIYGGDGHG